MIPEKKEISKMDPHDPLFFLPGGTLQTSAQESRTHAERRGDGEWRVRRLKFGEAKAVTICRIEVKTEEAA